MSPKNVAENYRKKGMKFLWTFSKDTKDTKQDKIVFLFFTKTTMTLHYNPWTILLTIATVNLPGLTIVSTISTIVLTSLTISLTMLTILSTMLTICLTTSTIALAPLTV